MISQTEHAGNFQALHKKGDPVILFNVWDAGSAAVVAKAGARAIATGSAPVAMANGFGDGEKMPLELALQNIQRIINAVDLPVTMDIEGGYGVSPQEVAVTISKVLDTGAIGFNFEDQIVGGEGLHAPDVQRGRIEAARAVCEQKGINAFVNARTDIFLKAKPDTHNEAMLVDAIERAHAYEKAGASGFFVPGLLDEALIGKMCQSTSLPVNIIALPNAPSNARLAELGVARISYGPVPYRQMAQWLGEQAQAALNGA